MGGQGGNNQVTRVKKKSMEEWEERLRVKKIRKESAVDRIIERNEQRKNSSLQNLNSGYSSSSPKSSPLTTKSSKYKMKNFSNLMLDRPKSLDRVYIGPERKTRKIQYFSRDECLNADDEESDMDVEVAAITKMLSTEPHSCTTQNYILIYTNKLSLRFIK